MKKYSNKTYWNQYMAVKDIIIGCILSKFLSLRAYFLINLITAN